MATPVTPHMCPRNRPWRRTSNIGASWPGIFNKPCVYSRRPAPEDRRWGSAGGTMTIGFIGLGVMGEPMCRNLATKSGRAVVGYDVAPAPLERLRAQGVTAARDIAALARDCDTVFLSLPGGDELETVCGTLLGAARAGQIVVDLGTSPVRLTRALAQAFAARGAAYADAPVARTREAAERGTLSVMA